MAEKKVESLYAVFLHDGDGHVEDDLEVVDDLEVEDDKDDFEVEDEDKDDLEVEDVDENADLVDISAHFYAIYAVSVPDVDADAGSSLPPTKKLKPSSLLHPLATLSLGDFPSSMSFACLGSSIYMFGGWIWKDNLRTSRTPRSSYYSERSIVSPSSSVYIIDTTRLPMTTLALKPGDLPRGPPLNTLKDCAFSVSLLGKIFAIPTTLDCDDECAEFLDPSSNPNEWQCIPNPRIRSYILSCDYYVTPCCYVVGSYILAMYSDGRAYLLDATNPQQGWKESTISNHMRPFHAASAAVVVDGLLCGWHPVDDLDRDTCFLACSLADLAKLDEFAACIFPGLGNNSASLTQVAPLVACHPSGRRIGGEINYGERKVIDIGDGRAAIVTSGFATEAEPLELHLVLDIVRLKKRDDIGQRRVEIIPLKSIYHVIESGKLITKYADFCGCFPMMGGSGAAYATPCVGSYYENVVTSRFQKRWE